MSPDPRLTPANGRVAALSLKGQVKAATFVDGWTRHVARPVVALRNAPDGRRERELLRGEAVTVFEDRDGWCFVQAARDGYVGYLPRDALHEMDRPDLRVCVRATHAYARADLKSPDLMTLSFGSRLRHLGQEGRFILTDAGHVPVMHLAPVERCEDDPVSVATLLLGTPYLWGGNSAFGIDCSGLVQTACLACGIACPGDSDLQAAGLGHAVTDGSAPRRGDLLFWKGHVAWVSGPDTILHANAHHMAVAFEGLAEAVTRIDAQGGGPVTGHRRLG
ncbi:NlpC/P60 family protein [Seohaeicola sp. SP36]|uniref:C40 family peptidase n=1 Tax=unclassified Seohaeicola TaxID=2641111 RepID=UPI00237AD8D3|nr:MULTISPECIES: NlpC/P60 family protein [unclassified Seohaeicola]MDD9705937.1 NlpC/P60 family protein [Seohaeicola sp. 4SK31]MDD9736225.1 NlpC/P60 family protein [Seohaeicola sp. SP36]